MKEEDKRKVFLSSVIVGLEDLRSDLIEFFEKKGYSVICYGDQYKGILTGKPGIADQCLVGVRTSDILALIIDRRYGTPSYKNDQDHSVSLTELEYLEAVKVGLPIFIFCRREVWIVHKIWKTNQNINFDWDNRYDHPSHLMSFLTKLENERHILRFSEVTELKNKLSKIEFGADSLKIEPKLIKENEEIEVSSFDSRLDKNVL